MKRYCLALDLIDDPALICEYEAHHNAVWPEVLQSIKDSGIVEMEIYRFNNRLFMIIDANDDFSFERKQQLDKQNVMVQKWEELMWKYQQSLPDSAKGEKWKLMNQLFQLTETNSFQ